jgi:hypothetical protein
MYIKHEKEYQDHTFGIKAMGEEGVENQEQAGKEAPEAECQALIC